MTTNVFNFPRMAAIVKHLKFSFIWRKFQSFYMIRHITINSIIRDLSNIERVYFVIVTTTDKKADNDYQQHFLITHGNYLLIQQESKASLRNE